MNPRPPINFAAYPNSVQLEISDLQFDADDLFKAFQARLNTIKANKSLARAVGAMGDSTTTDLVNEIFKELCQNQHPRIVACNEEEVDPRFNANGRISWSQLIQQVPISQFRDIGSQGMAYEYEVDVDEYVIQISKKGKKLIQLLQSCEGFFVEDMRVEEKVALEEKARVEELIEKFAKLHNQAIDYANEVEALYQRCRDSRAGQIGVSEARQLADTTLTSDTVNSSDTTNSTDTTDSSSSDTNHSADTTVVEVSTQFPSHIPDSESDSDSDSDSGSESDVNSILGDPTMDIPFRSPSLPQDDDTEMASVTEQQIERSDGHTQSDLASPFNRLAFPRQDSVAMSEGSSYTTDSDIPVYTARKPQAPSDEEKRHAEEFVARARLAGCDWGQVSRRYTRRFRVRRTVQYLVNKHPNFRDEYIRR